MSVSTGSLGNDERVKQETIMECLVGCAEALGYYLKPLGASEGFLIFPGQPPFPHKPAATSFSDWKFARLQGGRPSVGELTPLTAALRQ